MKSLSKLIGVVAIITLLVLESCVPTDEVVPDLAPLLTDGKWIFDEVDESDTFVKNFYEGIYGGREITFNSSGTFSQNSVNFNASGNWQFNDTQSILHFDIGSSEAEDWRILNISSTELYYEADFSGTKVKIRYTH